MTAARVAAAVLIALAFVGACARSEPPRVTPLGPPRGIDDVTGIWRSPHQATLELRRNGTFVLITAVSEALTGEYSLSQERFTALNTTGCGGAQGTYRILVAPEQRLEFGEPDDPCALRRTQLTADGFFYG